MTGDFPQEEEQKKICFRSIRRMSLLAKLCGIFFLPERRKGGGNDYAWKMGKERATEKSFLFRRKFGGVSYGGNEWL